MIKKVVLTSTFIMLANTAFAGDTLTGAEITALFTNKTFDVRNEAKGKDLQAYDNADGEHYMYVPWKDKIFERTWWVENNKHCTSHPKRGDSCKVMKPVGGGVYHGITDGTHTHTLKNFRDGNQLNK